jgi:hypothetical protein
MSTTLFALVILQGTSLSFSPGYTSAAECLQQYKGPFVSCFAYDPDSTTWTAFFQLPDGSFRTVGKIRGEAECKRYIGAFKDGIPVACRQLAIPTTCNVACVKPIEPSPPPPAVKPDTFGDVTVGPSKLEAKDFPTIAPLQPPKVVRAAQKRQRYAQPQFDPFSALVSLFTPRDY